MDDPIMAQPRGARKIAVEGVELESDDDSGEIVVVLPQDLVSQISIQKTAPAPKTHQQDSTHPEVPQDTGVEDPGGDILQDAKLCVRPPEDATDLALRQKYSI